MKTENLHAPRIKLEKYREKRKYLTTLLIKLN